MLQKAVEFMDQPVEVVAALIWQEQRFLICQRPVRKARALQWEFAGGKVEPGETKQQALVRECREELGITITVGKALTQIVHAYPDITVRLTVFHAVIAEGVPQKLEHNDLRWVLLEEAEAFDFCPADQVILEAIRKECSHG